VGLPAPSGADGAVIGGRETGIDEVEVRVRDLMWEHAGLVRSDEGLAAAREGLDALARARSGAVGSAAGVEACGGERSMRSREASFQLLVATLIVRCAQRRLESRGLHFTESHPHRDSERFLRDTVLAR
ncbi:MAG: hypothetical protein ACRELC_11815, partial [Gemmatimonadota bacterium]